MEDLNLNYLSLDDTEKVSGVEKKISNTSTKNEKAMKYIKAKAAFCIKVRYDIETAEKLLYINLCHHEDIPAPAKEDCPDAKGLWERKRCIPFFELPCFLSEFRNTKNEDDVDCKLVDYWINSTFYSEVTDDEVMMRSLVIHVVDTAGQGLNLNLLENGKMSYHSRRKLDVILPVIKPEYPAPKKKFIKRMQIPPYVDPRDHFLNTLIK